MQLKLQRSQREGGMMSKTVIFCLDARVEFTVEEARNITRYKLQKQVIYNSEASKKALAGGDARVDGSTVGHLKSIAFYALAAMNLNISIESLQRGQHVECKSLDELLGAEDAIMTACRNLKGYLDTAATFDGREVLFDFTTGEPEVLAAATVPAPMLVAPETTPVKVVQPPIPLPEPTAGAEPVIIPFAQTPGSTPARTRPVAEHPTLDGGDLEARLARAFRAVTPAQWRAIGILTIPILILTGVILSTLV